MIGNVIDTIRDIANTVAPNAVFECDEARMLNVKIDTVTRKVMAISAIGAEPIEVSNSFIYVEEPTYGYYDVPYSGFQRQRTFVRVYFCKFEEMHSSAYKGDSAYSDNEGGMYRIPMRDKIEDDMVRPFIARLRNSELGKRYPEMLASIRVVYPRPRFDANEVSVGLEIMYYENWCLSKYANISPFIPGQLVDILNGESRELVDDNGLILTSSNE